MGCCRFGDTIEGENVSTTMKGCEKVKGGERRKCATAQKSSNETHEFMARKNVTTGSFLVVAAAVGEDGGKFADLSAEDEIY